MAIDVFVSNTPHEASKWQLNKTMNGIYNLINICHKNSIQFLNLHIYLLILLVSF